MSLRIRYCVICAYMLNQKNASHIIIRTAVYRFHFPPRIFVPEKYEICYEYAIHNTIYYNCVGF